MMLNKTFFYSTVLFFYPDLYSMEQAKKSLFIDDWPTDSKPTTKSIHRASESVPLAKKSSEAYMNDAHDWVSFVNNQIAQARESAKEIYEEKLREKDAELAQAKKEHKARHDLVKQLHASLLEKEKELQICVGDIVVLADRNKHLAKQAAENAKMIETYKQIVEKL